MSTFFFSVPHGVFNHGANDISGIRHAVPTLVLATFIAPSRSGSDFVTYAPVPRSLTPCPDETYPYLRRQQRNCMTAAPGYVGSGLLGLGGIARRLISFAPA